jgi:hypothetical protein
LRARGMLRRCLSLRVGGWGESSCTDWSGVMLITVPIPLTCLSVHQEAERVRSITCKFITSRMIFANLAAATTAYSHPHPYHERQEIPLSGQLPSVEDAAEHFQTVITTRTKTPLLSHSMTQLSSPRSYLLMLDASGWVTPPISLGQYPLGMGGSIPRRLERSTSWF